MAFFEPMRHALIVKPLATAYRGIHAVTWRGEGRHPKISAASISW
ncbi:hypothetical protein [Rhizobium leguminosarum]|nr:hypothetical protein [Rhizobium leguminosarum]